MLPDDEREWLESLYRQNYPVLLTLCMADFDFRPSCRELAEECVQDTFVKAILELDRLRRHPNPPAWLRTACKHIAISKRRKIRNRQRILGYPVPLDSAGETADLRDELAVWMASEDLLSSKAQLMQALTLQEQAVYHAIYEERTSYRAAAEALSISDGALRGALQRVKHKIKKLLWDEQEERT